MFHLEGQATDDQKRRSSLTRNKLHDLSTFEVDPLENLIGFYSVVGNQRNVDENDNSMISAGAIRESSRTGVVSQTNVRGSDMTTNKPSHAQQQHMRNA